MENNKLDVFSLLRNDPTYSSILSSLSNFINILFNKLCNEITNMSQIASEVQEYTNEQCQSFIKIYCSSSSEGLKFDQYELILESFESLISKVLYPKLMALIGTDAKFDRLTNKFSFLTEEYLRLPLKFDMFELQCQLKLFEDDLSEKMTPKEKLVALRNLCNYMSSQLKDNSIIWKGVMYAVLKASIPNIKSHIRFCSLFRNRILLTTDEELSLLNMTRCFEEIEQLNLNNLNELNIPIEKLKEMNEDFEKRDLINNLNFSNGHFTFNNFIDDRLLALINSGKDSWNNLYDKKPDVPVITPQEIDANMELIQINIHQLIQDYYNVEAKGLKMSEMDTMRHLLSNLIKIIKKEKEKN